MMMQMAVRFMHEKTARAILGNLIQAFDPDGDFTYKPVSSNIESEYNKDKKLQRYDQMIGRISGIPNPAIVPIVALIVARQLELLGDEYQTLAPYVKKLMNTPNEKEGGGDQPKDAKDMPTSNQNGQPQSLQEQSAREGMI